MITLKTYENFSKITRYDLSNFILDCDEFFKSDFVEILNFYNGSTRSLNILSLRKMADLISEVNKVNSLFSNYKQMFVTVDYWELCVLLENVKSKLLFTNKISKYLRSSIVMGRSKRGTSFEYTMSPEETLERISKDVLDNPDYENNWFDIALENDLKESDWDIEGGKKLNLSNNAFQANLVTSVFDNLIGDRIYGKDLKKKLTLTDDDLETLDYKETVNQTVEIISRISKNDIPEFSSMGMNSSIWKGSNASQINLPIIVRELAGLFKTDDLFTDFKVRSINYSEGDIRINYEVKTKRDFVIINNVSI